MRVKGKLVTWNDEKGYGFISPDDGGQRVFVHIKAFRSRRQRSESDQLLVYAVSTDAQGRSRAVNVTFDGAGFTGKSRFMKGAFLILVALIFLAGVGAFANIERIPNQIALLYGLVSVITFFTYVVDKTAARSGAWRTSENTLHMLSLTGGWPGGLIAQQTLRHKSSKQSFRAVFWFTVLLNCAALFWILTPNGSAALQSFIYRMVY